MRFCLFSDVEFRSAHGTSGVLKALMQHLNLAECLRHGCLQIAQTGLAVLLYRQTELCRLIFRIGDNLVCLCVCLCDNGRLADRLADVLLRLCAQVCRDMDAPSVAQRAELCGRLALLGVALPVFLSLARMAVGVLQ